MTAFKIGDIVQLKSGGPKMTVTQVPDALRDNYFTTWFAGSKKEAGSFPEQTLAAMSDERSK